MKINTIPTLDRRQFLKESAASLACLPTMRFLSLLGKGKGEMAQIALIKTSDRKAGVQEVFKIFDSPLIKEKKVLLKPNFNTADPCPGSTHNDTLSQIVKEIHKKGAKEITVGERSGPPPTESVMKKKRIYQLAKDLDFKIVNFEKLSEDHWVHFKPEGIHWKNGFYIARPAAEAEHFISTCCLKTHQYGGVFTLSLKLAVGLTPKKLMGELHGNKQHMRRMIAEINLGYEPDLIVLDGLEAFVDRGPMKGPKKTANLFIAGKDRVAMDAVGLAVLKELGSNQAIMETKIFEQEQIARAVELNLGISSAAQIDFLTPDRKSRAYADKLRSILAQG